MICLMLSSALIGCFTVPLISKKETQHFYNLLKTRDGHFCQFLISIIDRFQKRLIEYSGAGRARGSGVAVMEIISEDCYNEC